MYSLSDSEMQAKGYRGMCIHMNIYISNKSPFSVSLSCIISKTHTCLRPSLAGLSLSVLSLKENIQKKILCQIVRPLCSRDAAFKNCLVPFPSHRERSSRTRPQPHRARCQRNTQSSPQVPPHLDGRRGSKCQCCLRGTL